MLAIPAPTIPELRFIRGKPWGMVNLIVPPPILGVCGGDLWVNFSPRSVIGLIELFGSEERYRTALATSRVEIVYVLPRTRHPENPEDYKEYEVLPIDEVQAEIVRRTLTEDAAYDWEPKIELFNDFPVYDFRIRLYHGDKGLTVDLSLSARTVRVIENYAIIAEQPLSAYGFSLLESLAEQRQSRE